MSTVLFLRKKYLAATLPLDADLLLALAAKKSREFILIHPEYKLSFWQKIDFYYFFFQYKRGTPISYLTHHKEFFGLDFFVNRHTLIPRPETELLVEETLKKINKQTLLIDVGTGSGCIPISILTTTKNADVNAIAIDISALALKIARLNAALHKAKIKFLRGNLLEPFLKDSNYPNFSGQLIITANLPYLTKEQFKNEQTIQSEPRSALIANENGLALYRELLEQIKNLNTPFIAFFEFDQRQTESITKLIKSFFSNANLEIKKDLAGRDRLVIITQD